MMLPNIYISSKKARLDLEKKLRHKLSESEIACFNMGFAAGRDQVKEHLVSSLGYTLSDTQKHDSVSGVIEPLVDE